MTEAEWLACDDLKLMLDFLLGKVSDRKLRLFACGCVWEHLRVMCPPHRDWGRMPSAVLLSEGYADGLVARDDWLKGTREGFHFGPWNNEDIRQEAAYAV